MKRRCKYRQIVGHPWLVPRVFTKVTRGKRSGHASIGTLSFYTSARGKTLRDMLDGKLVPIHTRSTERRVKRQLKQWRRLGFDYHG